MLLEDGRWRPEGWHQNHRCYHRCAEQGRTSAHPMSREGKSDDVIDRPALQLVYGDKARQERYARGGRAKLIAVWRCHLRVPVYFRRGFRRETGHPSALKAATIPKRRPAAR